MAKAARKNASRDAKSTAKKAARRSARPADPKAAMRAALLRLCAEAGWRDLSLAGIAEEAGLDLAAAHQAYATKAALLVGLVRDIDANILDSLKGDPLEGSAKDKLFDLLMRRFDLIQQSRDGYAALLQELPQTPLEATAGACQMRRSLRLMLESAGISASGIKGALRLQGLIAIHLAGLRAWLRDDSADLVKTMAEIDKRLNQAVKLTEMMSAGLKRAETFRADAAKAARGDAA